MNSKDALQKEIETGLTAHAYLFIGESKDQVSNLVQVLISGTKCLSEDISILETPSESGKAGEIKAKLVKDFLRQLYLTPHGKLRIGIIKEADSLNSHSANALLKTLEEPPANLIIVLTAKNESMLATIRSRCRIYRVASKNVHTFSYNDILTGSLAKAFKTIENLVKNNEVESFLAETEGYLSKKMREDGKSVYADLLAYLYKIRKQIKNNANQRLGLENLVLKIREHK